MKIKNRKNKKNKDYTETEMNELKTPVKTLNLILVVIGISTIIFTLIMFIFFYKFQAIPDTLCERFYTVIVGELGVTGVIQIVKIICKNKYSNFDSDEICDEINVDNIAELKINNDIVGNNDNNENGDDIVG